MDAEAKNDIRKTSPQDDVVAGSKRYTIPGTTMAMGRYAFFTQKHPEKADVIG